MRESGERVLLHVISDCEAQFEHYCSNDCLTSSRSRLDGIEHHSISNSLPSTVSTNTRSIFTACSPSRASRMSVVFCAADGASR
jgi:hypothetical protein